jgi:Kef-type K+ transport system membrane component KefB
VRVENLRSVLLLPAFFAFTGLRTQIGLLNLGALMNTRGLMELIALNIGYDMDILSQHIVTMLVIMALVTTIMTGPLVTGFGKTREMAGA